MLVLDDTFASDEVLDFLESTQEPVFDNSSAHRYADRGYKLNIVDPDQTKGQRIVALSEAYLDDVKRHCDEQTAQAITLCKDKAACRRALAPLFPDYVFKEYSIDELASVDPTSFALPVVLKPSTGFFSLGIYPIFSKEDWDHALKDIDEHSDIWESQYGSAVVSNANFLVESYLDGQEYAIDAYFNEQGTPVILDVLQHDFAGNDDVSDRLYFTSKEIIEGNFERMQSFLEKSNEIFGMRNFPVHVEVRVDDAGAIIPIEFNPLRFAGLCCTDLSYFAYGFKTYEMYLRNEQPKWDEILKGKEGKRYCVLILSTDGSALPEHYLFDYKGLSEHFSHVLGMRQMDAKQYNTFGMLFTEVADGQFQQEKDYILHTTLREFLS